MRYRPKKKLRKELKFRSDSAGAQCVYIDRFTKAAFMKPRSVRCKHNIIEKFIREIKTYITRNFEVTRRTN
jgi:hypothetical protein